MNETPLGRLHETFCREALVANYQPSTIEWWKSAISQLERHFPGQLEKPSAFTLDRLRRYFFDKRESGWTSHTYHSQYRALRAFAVWLVQHGHLPVNPFDAIPRPRLSRLLPKRISREAAARLVEVAYHGQRVGRFLRHRDRGIVAVMLYAGLRSREVRSLEVRDVDLQNRVLSVRSGKGDKDRLVPMGSRLHGYLESYVRERSASGKSGDIFFTVLKTSDGLSASGLRRLTARLKGASGIDFSPHRLRHTFATLMLEGGCDLFALKEMMGHADIATTTLYLSATTAHLKKAIAKHPLG